MIGMASQTGMRGWAGSPLTKMGAMLERKRRCIRYMPKDRREERATKREGRTLSMQVKRRKAPKVAQRTLGVQNSHDHSSMGVSMTFPGTPAYQNDHPVNAAPTRKHKRPTQARLPRDQWR